jgi:hypothetical protein
VPAEVDQLQEAGCRDALLVVDDILLGEMSHAKEPITASLAGG